MTKEIVEKIIMCLMQKGFPQMNSFYSQEELSEIGFLSVGENVLISKNQHI